MFIVRTSHSKMHVPIAQPNRLHVRWKAEAQNEQQSKELSEKESKDLQHTIDRKGVNSPEGIRAPRTMAYPNLSSYSLQPVVA
jgi:hypothetical protein